MRNSNCGFWISKGDGKGIGRREKAGGRRHSAGGRRQEAVGRMQEAGRFVPRFDFLSYLRLGCEGPMSLQSEHNYVLSLARAPVMRLGVSLVGLKPFKQFPFLPVRFACHPS